MTSLKRIPTGKGSRKSHAEQEREQFERTQESSFRKAINEDEVPIKMKHVRTMIIGTHTDKSGTVFWKLVALTPPIHTDITAWKFCHTIHLLLRDGHPKFINDAIDNLDRIQTLGEHFRHLPVGYGSLIKCYCELLITKLHFHDHFRNSPGNMQLTPELLTAITENDANNYFQMAVEILDYMEKILNLYEAVFHSLNPSRSNSMTKTGQCRLAPLILCIQDSSCLYDLIVRILFQLHKVVASDILSGHRKRFNSQFKLLQQFYNGTRNLQYFKMLIQVPHLPQNPPNFLVESELRSHVAPVVVLEEEQPDSTDSVLVDTSEPKPPPIPPHPHPDVVNSHNGSLVDVMAEKESLIDALQNELRLVRSQMQKERSDASYIKGQLKLRINDLESTVGELDSELMAERKSKESILAQVEAAAATADAVTKLSEEETKRRTAEEKFSKIKEVYQKLRDEHISLIRAKSEMEKLLSLEKDKAQQAMEKREESERARKHLEAQLSQSHELEQSIILAQQDVQEANEKIEALRKEADELSSSNEHFKTILRENEEHYTANTQRLQAQEEYLCPKHSGSLFDFLENAAQSVVKKKNHIKTEFERLEKLIKNFTAEKQVLDELRESFLSLADDDHPSVCKDSAIRDFIEENLEQLHEIRDKDPRFALYMDGKIDLEKLFLRYAIEGLCIQEQLLEKKICKVIDEFDEIRLLRAELHQEESLITSIMTSLDELERINKYSPLVKLAESGKTLKSLSENCVLNCTDGGMALIKHALNQFDNASHSVMKASPDFTLIYAPYLESLLENLSSTYDQYISDKHITTPCLIGIVGQFSSHMASFLLYAKASSHASTNIENADDLVSRLELLGEQSVKLLEKLNTPESVTDFVQHLKEQFDRCIELVVKCEDVVPSQEDVAMTVQREMEAMDKAIGEAVEKFTNLLVESRAKDSGMQLEVNENILGTCGDLMAAVRILVERSSALQKEIVAAGKGGASPREFYKRNHRWTEGLISGAKAVALACQALVGAADEVANNKGKFEEVIVASREIAASSMQLVMASRVKADKSSQKLGNVNTAAKTISTLTGTVVATAESCREKLTESTTLDFSKLSLHSTKRLEMETQVKMLETEKQLETERAKLAELRRHHYKLAGEIQEDTD